MGEELDEYLIVGQLLTSAVYCSFVIFISLKNSTVTYLFTVRKLIELFDTTGARLFPLPPKFIQRSNFNNKSKFKRHYITVNILVERLRVQQR